MRERSSTKGDRPEGEKDWVFGGNLPERKERTRGKNTGLLRMQSNSLGLVGDNKKKLKRTIKKVKPIRGPNVRKRKRYEFEIEVYCWTFGRV